MQWLGQFYINTRLPFGLRSAPSIFNKFADLVCWIIQNITNNPNITHYSDDYFIVKSQDLQETEKELANVKHILEHLNIPITTEKIEGPSTTITYLGIQINSHNQTIQLPDDKLHELITLLPTWLHKKKCTQKELLSLIGKLRFASKVIRPGRIFLSRLITIAHTVKRLHHSIYLNKEAQADVKWWIDNITHLNRRFVIPDNFTITSDDIKLYTDASSTIGFRAIYHNAWFQSTWPSAFATSSIDYKELFAIWAACLTWGTQWPGKRIIFITDNKPITEIWHSGSSHSPTIMSLVRNIYSMAARHQFSVSFKHILGHSNPIADALSCLKNDRFRILAPPANEEPTPLPHNVWLI